MLSGTKYIRTKTTGGIQMEIKGAQLVVKALKEEGVEMLFAYPGGQAMDLFDALYEQNDIEMILPRHEQGLIHAADGYARSTGKVGVCLVTSGPGATNLVTGIATANYDCVPLVCITGQVPTHLIGNDAFQEVDIVGITRSICKHSVTVQKREDLGLALKEAFYIARTGKPGPVVVDIPKDIQAAFGSKEYPKEVNIRSYKPCKSIHEGQLKKALEVLNHAKKPLFLIGGGVKIAKAGIEMTALVNKTNVPVVTTIMGKGTVDTTHPLYLGNLGIHGSYAANTAISECDVLFSIGTRFNDRITGKTSEFAKNATIIHIDIDASSIARNIVVDIPIVADAKIAIEKMNQFAQPLAISEWIKQVTGWKKQYPIQMNQYEGITAEKIIKTINDMFQESIIVTDVGQNQLWTTQYLELNEKKQMLTSGGLGTMGYGLPAAIGAQIGNPGKSVICITGDGGMQMNLQEMATAVSYELPIIICILNNSYLGNVRQWQELFYQKRYSSTCLKYRKSCQKSCTGQDKCPTTYIPDFLKLADTYEANGIRVETEEAIRPAFEVAMKNRTTPTIIEFIIEREANVFPIVPPGKALNEMIMDC